MLLLMSQEVLLVLSPLMLVIVVTWVLGWAKIPDDARFRGRLGIYGMDFTVGKTAGFGLRLVTALFVYLGAAVAGGRGLGTGPALLLGAISLVVLLIGQIAAIRRAVGPP